MNNNPGISPSAFRLDIHHHLVPDFYVSTLERRGLQALHGAGFPKWSTGRSLELMDRYGIAAAVASISSPGVYQGDASLAASLARQCNEFAARMVQEHPDRFGFFAALPLPAVEPALQEAVYALDTLKADGLVLLASSGEQFLGDPDLEELMAELNRRKAVVFVHPNIHPSSTALRLDIPGFYIEFMFDTTRAVANLIFSGSLERHPDIRWILAHAGGTVPFIAWRLALANLEPKLLEKAPRGVQAYLSSFYYDTALSPSAPAMKALLELVPPGQILFGSDYPYAPEPLVAKEIQDFERLDVLDEAAKRLIQRGSGLALFPRFRRLGEDQAAAILPDLRQRPKIPLRMRLALAMLRKLLP